MRSITIAAAILALGPASGAGCKPTVKTISSAGKTPSQAQRTPPAPHSTPRTTGSPDSARPHTTHGLYTKKNPTSTAGRGTPSLDDLFRPSAWILIDGKEGTFAKTDGKPAVHWLIESPVSAAPTFRVAVYEPLLGTPADFSALLYPLGEGDTQRIAYSIRARDGRFQIGNDYSLRHPGPDFVVRNLATGDVVSEIAPLAPGTYELTAGIKNLAIGKEGLAVTRFTVVDGE